MLSKSSQENWLKNACLVKKPLQKRFSLQKTIYIQYMDACARETRFSQMDKKSIETVPIATLTTVSTANLSYYIISQSNQTPNISSPTSSLKLTVQVTG